jgi:DNA-binding transcriptional ArsR family regulator
MVKYSSESLDDIFSALADPTRRSMIERLAVEGELMVTTLAEPYDMSLPAISKHLRVLERAGLLVQEKNGRIRHCQLVAEPLQAAASWIDQYSQFWEAKFDSLADYLAEIQSQHERRSKKWKQNW